MTLILVTAPGAQATFEKWIDRGDWITVFENVDFCHSEFGRLVFFPISPADSERCVIDGSTAPDHPTYGCGYRYILKRVTRDIKLFEFKPEEPAEPQPEKQKKRKRRDR